MTRSLSLFLLVALVVPLHASGQEVPIPQRLTLADAIRIAQENNPTVAVARQEAALGEAEILAARQRPNPVLEAISEGYRSGSGGFGNGQELTIQLSQELETGGRRGSRVRVASAGRLAADARLADVGRLLRRQVGRAYFGLSGARADAAAAAAALQEIDRIITVNRAKYQQGEISGGELRRLEVERLRFEEDALSAELATRRATSELRAMLGSTRLDLPVDPIEGLAVPDPGGQTPGVPGLGALALASRPDISALRHQREQARAELQLQRALRSPAPTLAAGYRRDFGDSGVVLGVSVPVPLFDRNAAGVARADTSARLADARLREAESAVNVEVQQAADLVDISRRRVQALERDYLARAREARDSAAAAYRAGEAELIDFLDAQRAFRDVQRAHTAALLELRLSLFQLQTTIGATPGEPLS
ncbi:MAG: TolC family protein [Acidobacteria bacterium]|nr:MAG: TolC family protein [Acidobacteriota bacterium]